MGRFLLVINHNVWSPDLCYDASMSFPLGDLALGLSSILTLRILLLSPSPGTDLKISLEIFINLLLVSYFSLCLLESAPFSHC